MIALAVVVLVLVSTNALLLAAVLRFEDERRTYVTALLAERKYPGAAQAVLAPSAVEEPREFIVPEGL